MVKAAPQKNAIRSESPAPLDEPYCIEGDLGDPVNKPDKYIFPNGDEVHMCAGEVISREELPIPGLDYICRTPSTTRSS